MSAVPRGTPAKSRASSNEDAPQPTIALPPPRNVELLAANAIKADKSGAAFSPSIVSGLVGLSDVLSIFLPGLVIYFAYVGASSETFADYYSALFIVAVVTVAAFYLADLYKIELLGHVRKQLRRVLELCTIVFLLLVAFAFALKISDNFSRVWAFTSFLSATALICLTRSSCAYVLKKGAQSGRLTRNVAIVGASEQARRLIAHLDHSSEPWNVVVGVFDDRGSRLGPDVWGYPILGKVDDLIAFARQRRIDDVIVTLPWSAENRIRELVEKLTELPVHVHLAPDLAGFTYPKAKYGTLNGITTLDVASKPLEGWKLVVKTLEDKILATLLLLVLSPCMALIALAIKLDSKGPVLFRQTRYGFNNGAFSVFKFRTMYHNAAGDAGTQQAKRDDPRITRVGRILRRTSLDELPQIFNVIGGSMSMVGPRPHPVPLNQQYAALIRGYYARHRVKPGITGWAQVNGLRGETDTPDKMKARVEFDIEYIENWSLLRDLYILAKTAYIVWIQDTAY